MNLKPFSILLDTAEHFHQDGVDFSNRFDLLWEAGPLMGKTGRTKSFMDLLMGCECALKSHCFLSHQGDNPKDVYTKVVTQAGHKIALLADYAAFPQYRSEYDFLKSRLANFPVALRYSRNAYKSFFPDLKDRDQADLNYSQTIGNDTWVMQIRGSLDKLLAFSSAQFQGFLSFDLEKIVAHSKEIENFNQSIRR